MHYSVALVHCCAALGIDARVVNLHRGIAESYPLGGEAAAGVDEHVTTEVYCRELAQWVMVDPDFDCTYELRGKPLSAWDIHRAHLAGERVTSVKGPGAAAYDSLGEDFYEVTLPSYYAHVSLLMRNDFISDPDGPVPILHLVDDATPPILWYAGEDMRLRRDMLGPAVRREVVHRRDAAAHRRQPRVGVGLRRHRARALGRGDAARGDRASSGSPCTGPSGGTVSGRRRPIASTGSSTAPGNR